MRTLKFGYKVFLACHGEKGDWGVLFANQLSCIKLRVRLICKDQADLQVQLLKLICKENSSILSF